MRMLMLEGSRLVPLLAHIRPAWSYLQCELGHTLVAVFALPTTSHTLLAVGSSTGISTVTALAYMGDARSKRGSEYIEAVCTVGEMALLEENRHSTNKSSELLAKNYQKHSEDPRLHEMGQIL